MRTVSCLIFAFIICLGLVNFSLAENTEVNTTSNNIETTSSGDEKTITADVKRTNKKRVVRIPDYYLDGFMYKDEKGNRNGFGYEVLREVAKYAGWDYEYVSCDRSRCVEMLEKGEIDLIDSCLYSQSRAEKVKFSRINMGTGSEAIVVKAENSKYKPYDFKNYNGMKIGIVDEDFWEKSINDIVKEKGFNAEIVKFKTYAELYDALDDGKIDAIAAMGIQKTETHKTLFEFGAFTYYLAVNKNNSELLSELNSAMEQIWISDSTYFSTVYNKYYKRNSDESVLYLTDEEKAYIKENGTVKALLLGNRGPIAYFDKNGAEGIVPDLVRRIMSKVGLQVEFVECNTYKEAFEKVKDKSNLISSFFYDYSFAENNGIEMTEPYLDSVPYTVVVNKDIKSIENRNLKVACVNNYLLTERFLASKYDRKQLVFYKTEKECIEAVNNGDADITYVSTYIAEDVLRRDNLYDVTMAINSGFNYPVSIGVSKDEDIRLMTILNKAINNLSPKEVENVISKYTILQKDDVGILVFIERNALAFIVVLCLFIIVGAYVVFRIFSFKKKYDEKIFNLAYIDRITNIWNVNGFILEAAKKIDLNDFETRSFAIIALDISKFRLICENYGKFVGDRILKYIAESLTHHLPYGGVLAKSRTDGFIILMPYYEKVECSKFLENFYEKTRYYEDGGVAFKFKFQSGVYLITDRNKDVNIEIAIDMADTAKKDVENANQDKIVFFDNIMEEKIIKYKEIVERMEPALQNREFVVYYQPKVDMETEEIVGAEALIRWISKDKGFMNPGEFIPIFEKEGFVIELDFFVFEEVLKLIRDWLDKGKEPIVISVNQSRLHLSNPFYIERLQNLIDKYKVPTKYVELELTENLFIDAEAALEVVNKVKALGFSISVDDFGSGFSSLNMLKSMPIDVVKIDREFLTESENSTKAQKIISKIVEMAKELDMNVICEGVETEEQAVFLKSIGCYLAQGFLYARPMPENEFLDRVESNKDKR